MLGDGFLTATHFFRIYPLLKRLVTVKAQYACTLVLGTNRRQHDQQNKPLTVASGSLGSHPRPAATTVLPQHDQASSPSERSPILPVRLLAASAPLPAPAPVPVPTPAPAPLVGPKLSLSSSAAAETVGFLVVVGDNDWSLPRTGRSGLLGLGGRMNIRVCPSCPLCTQSLPPRLRVWP